MPSLSNADRQLLDALRDLERVWSHAGDTWRDDARREFADEFIEPFGPAIRGAVGAIGEVNALLRQAIRDCSE